MRRRVAVLSAALLAAMTMIWGAAASASTVPAEGDYQTQIVGGTHVPNGKYPFMATLQDKRKSDAHKGHLCGGSLIDKDTVLTAGHCVTDILADKPGGYDYPNREQMRVIVGRTQLISTQGQKRSVKKIFLHPDYKSSPNPKKDAAVLKLSRPVNNITPIKLAQVTSTNKLEQPGQRTTVAGWGEMYYQPNNQEASYYPYRMRQAHPPVQSDDYTDYIYDQWLPSYGIYGFDFEGPIMVGAGAFEEDTCQGDSGGPMWVTANGARTQIGITSFGYGCGVKDVPGVYAEVNAPSIATFIKSAAKK